MWVWVCVCYKHERAVFPSNLEIQRLCEASIFVDSQIEDQEVTK